MGIRDLSGAARRLRRDPRLKYNFEDLSGVALSLNDCNVNNQEILSVFYGFEKDINSCQLSFKHNIKIIDWK